MTELEMYNIGAVPVAKRHSLLESPDIGERWPDQFDAITVEQQVSRLYKAKEARRQLDYFFDIPANRDPGFLHGVIWHFANNVTHSVVMFDTNASYSKTTFLTAAVIGTPKYGYATARGVDTLSGDESFDVRSADYLTYFKAPYDFEPGEGEVLSMMIGEARDQLTDSLQ